MENKHTPAPWNFNNGYIKGEKYNIASVNSCKTTEGMANARLIAAAPELLEALEACLKKGKRWHPCDSVVQNAQMAIRKARSE